MDKIKNFILETKEVEKTYASPLKRLLSFIIDAVIIFVFCNTFFGVAKYYGINTDFYKEEAVIENKGAEDEKIVMKNTTDNKMLFKIYLFSSAVSALYFMIFLSSKKQATIGNQIFKIMVVHTKKVRLNPLNAFIRYIATILNNSIYGVGYLLYFFRKDRAFLQDILSETRVINLKKE